MAVLERRRLLKAAAVDEIVERAQLLPARVDSPPPDLWTLLSLARTHALSACDAAYLELAIRLGVPLAVKDGPLAQAAGKAGLLAP